MKKERKIRKMNKNLLNWFKLIGIGAILVLIFIAAPRCTQITKDIAKFLYELDDEYITRFWTILLALTSMFVLFFFKNIKEESRGE